MRRLLLLGLVLAAPAMAQTAQTPPPTDQARYEGCIAAVTAPGGAEKAEMFGREWHARGGGVPALHCEALAQMQLHAYGRAVATLVAAAREAEARKNPLAPALWGQAGNAAFLAGGRNREAMGYLDRAIAATPESEKEALGGLYMDRAEVEVETGAHAPARADLQKATELLPENATAWLLSAALARRTGDLTGASHAIAEASRLDPTGPDVLLEQANIAAANGDMAAATRVWQRVVEVAPGSEAATIARRELARK